MRRLRYAINVTLDGCSITGEGSPGRGVDRYWTAEMERADALLFGRVTYEMMEWAWRKPATGTWPDWMGEWDPVRRDHRPGEEVRRVEHAERVDWNAELVRGDLGQAVQRLKQEPGEGLFVGGVTLPLALADLGLIDEYEFLCSRSCRTRADVARRSARAHRARARRSPGVPVGAVALRYQVPRDDRLT